MRELEGRNCVLRYPVEGDAEEFIAGARASRTLHEGLVYPPGGIKAFHTYLEKNLSDANECFVLTESASDKIAGAVNLSQIVFGQFQSAYLGYYLFEGFTGRGIMTDAINTIQCFVFGDFGLHRIEANVQPHNTASVRLVERCGFVREGFSRRYLRIGGIWRDHERWASLREDFLSREGLQND